MAGNRNPKQAAFCAEYMIDLNATQAAIRAGYSVKTAASQGERLLRNVEIQKEVQRLMDERGKSVQVTADRVISELSCMAFYDPLSVAMYLRDVTEEEKNAGIEAIDGKVMVAIRRPQDLSYLPETVRRCIVGWSWDKAGNFTLKLASKDRALELIGRHLGMFRERIEVTGKDGKPIKSETSHAISEEMQETIIAKTLEAARIAARVAAPASFRGEGSEE